MKTQLNQVALVAMAGWAAVTVQGSPFFSDNFNSYADGPLADTALWSRAPSNADPSGYPTIAGGAVSYNWNTVSNDAPVGANHTVASENQLATGMLYASFTLNVSSAPTTAASAVTYPGFFGFRNSNGSATRGRVGINPGSVAGTFQLGVSSGTSTQDSFTFAGLDLSPNTAYTVVIGYNIDTTAADLWINPANVGASPVASAAGANSVQSIRRIALDLRNRPSSGLVDLGAFTLDDLVVATTLSEVGVAAVPEPSTLSLVSGLFIFGLMAARKRLRR